MKKLTLISYISWAVLLVLILTFGTTVSQQISKFVSTYFINRRTELRDVNVQLDNYYPIEEEIKISYTTLPNNDEDYGLVFTSLDEDIFTVSNKKMIGKRLDNDSNVGRLQITSTKYPEFSKIVNVKFSKVYPSNFSFVSSIKANNNTVKTYLGIPFIVSLKTESDKTITELNTEFQYNEDYFSVLELAENKYQLTPKVPNLSPGDQFEKVSTNISFVVNGIKKDLTVSINPSLSPLNIDDIKLLNKNGEAVLSEEYLAGSTFKLAIIYQNQVHDDIPYSLTYNQEYIQIDEQNNIKLLKAGDIDLTINLPNNISFVKQLEIRNDLKLPNLKGATIDNEGRIVLLDKERKKIIIEPKGTYKDYELHFSSSSSITYEDQELEDNIIYLNGLENQTGTLKIVIDDGKSHLEKTYDIIVIHNRNDSSSIRQRINTFIHKVAGHMAFFTLLAILGCLCFIYNPFKKKWLNVVVNFSVGWFLGFLTEFIQYFMPGRSSRFLDVLIDMGGFCIGFILTMFIYWLIKKKQSKKQLAK